MSKARQLLKMFWLLVFGAFISAVFLLVLALVILVLGWSVLYMTDAVKGLI